MLRYTRGMNTQTSLNNAPLMRKSCRMIKRIFDIIAALITLVFIYPWAFLIIGCCIKIYMPGPILFKQKRTGINGKVFICYKFRSMDSKNRADEFVDPEKNTLTLGNFLRMTSLDELPQFWNVLKGDMSLIGPRPERPLFVEKFKEEIPRYMIKHQVRPGITGWAQVNGFRGDTSIRSRIEHDLYYIENWSLGLDIKILFLTFFKGFVNKNAY